MKKKSIFFLSLLISAVLAAGCGGGSGKSGGDTKETSEPGSNTGGFVFAKGETYDTGAFTGICPDGWTYVPVKEIFSDDDKTDPKSAALYKGMESETDSFRCANVQVTLYEKDVYLIDSRGFYDKTEDKTLEIDGKTWEGFLGDYGSYKNFLFTMEDETCIWQVTGLLNGSKSTFELSDKDFETILASLSDYSHSSASSGTVIEEPETPKATPAPSPAPETNEESFSVLHPEAPEGGGTTVPERNTESFTVLHPEAPEGGGTTIPDTPHEHSLTAYYNVDSTCTEDGHWTYYVCSECGAVLDYQYNPTTIAEEVIPAKGHDWVRVEGGDPGDCQHQGKKFYECSRCGEETIEYLGYGPHNYVPNGHSDGTCVDSSYNYYRCTICGDEYAEDLGALGPYTSKEYHKGPFHWDVYSYGAHSLDCDACGMPTETESHDPYLIWIPNPASPSMNHVQKCTKCGYVLDFLAPEIHQMSGGTCIICGYTGSMG